MAYTTPMLGFPLLKLLSLLVYPLSQVLIMLFVGLYLLLRGRLRSAFTVCGAATLWLWLCTMPRVADGFIARLEKHYPPVAAAKLPRADAIVLLGGAIRGEVSTATLADMSGVGDRLVFAVALFKAGKAPLILVTGGARAGEIPEAVLIKNILLTMGVPAENIVLETRNRVTRDNRRTMPETLGAMGVESILLVTSAFHMPRAMLVFESLELPVYPAPTDHQVLLDRQRAFLWGFLPSVKALQRTTWAFHEQVGYWYYKLQL